MDRLRAVLANTWGVVVLDGIGEFTPHQYRSVVERAWVRAGAYIMREAKISENNFSIFT
jgi:hypothetical protein